MNSFIERLNLITDPTGSTALTDTTYFSADGLDSNDGSPDNPRLTIDGTTLTTAYAVLGADQVYNTSNAIPTPNNVALYGDGMVVLDGEGTAQRIAPSFNAGISLKNFIVRGFSNLYQVFNAANGENVENCIFLDNIGCILEKRFNDVKNCLFLNDVKIQTGTNASWFGNVFHNSIVTRSQSIFNPTNGVIVIHSNIFKSCTIDIGLEYITDFEYCLFHNTIFIIDGVTYTSLSNVLLDHPTAFPNSIETDPMFKGDPANFEYRVVEDTSPCIQGGKGGSNIGGTNIGLVFNYSNIQSSSNITFAPNGSLTLSDPALDGQIVWEDVLGRVIINPFLRLNGLPDFLNNLIRTVQSTMPEKPSKYTLQIETKDKNEAYKPIKVYRFGYKIGEDENGLSSGDHEYHELNQERLRVIGVRVTMTILA